MKRTLAELAELTRSQLIGDPHHLIAGVEDLECAGSEEATFLVNPIYKSLLEHTKAGVICIDINTVPIPGKNFLVSEAPDLTFQFIVKAFLANEAGKSGFEAIHPSAVIHPTVKLGKDVEVGPNAVIDQGCVIGDFTRIHALASIGPEVQIGSHCIIHSNVTIRERCKLGDRVILQPGVVIGSCGFGYATDAKGNHTKHEQLGIVILEDDVEVGANSTIDRARFKATRICQGTKIDNLVMIAHNVVLGPNNIIVSQTGISGSVTTGRNVVMGGQTGVVGHLDIASGAMFAARSGIKKSILKPGKYGGNPAIPLDEHNRQQVTLRKLLKTDKQA